MTTKISIIVPVYNIKEYLPSCLDSIIAQSFTDFELILIDDGSSDGSGDICEYYSLLDNRIRVYHKTNEGVSKARNFGIEIAEGEWIAFIDGDDYIVPEYLEALVNSISGPGVGMACCNMLFVNPDGTTTQCPYIETQKFSSISIRNTFFSDGKTKVQFYSPVNKIIRRSLIGDIRFKPFALGEDLLFIFELLGNNTDIIVIPLMGYHYIKRHDSATTAKFSIKRLDYVKSAHMITELASSYSNNLFLEAQVWTLRHIIVTIRQIYRTKLEISCKDFIKNEKLYIKQHKELLNKLELKRRLDYLMLSCIPKVYRFL